MSKSPQGSDPVNIFKVCLVCKDKVVLHCKYSGGCLILERGLGKGVVAEGPPALTLLIPGVPLLHLPEVFLITRLN